MTPFFELMPIVLAASSLDTVDDQSGKRPILLTTVGEDEVGAVIPEVLGGALIVPPNN